MTIQADTDEHVTRAKNLAARVATEAYAEALRVQLMQLFPNGAMMGLDGVHAHEMLVTSRGPNGEIGPSFLLRAVFEIDTDEDNMAAAVRRGRAEGQA